MGDSCSSFLKHTSRQGALIVLAGWLSATCAEAKTAKVQPIIAKVQRIDTFDYGIYLANKVATKTNDLGVTYHTVNDAQLIASTDTIPAQLGVKFGFRYTIIGKPEDAIVTVRQVTVYPPTGVVSPKMGVLHTNSFSTRNQIGSPFGAGYEIDEPWELVPGVWTIQLWVGDQKLAEHSFTVAAPGDATLEKAQF